MAETESELTPELREVKARVESSEGWAERKRDIDLQYNIASPIPMGLSEELSPELQAMKQKYEQSHGKDASTQPGQQVSGTEPVKFSPAWDYTEQQAQEALQREWPYWHAENMVEIQNPDNFASVFGGFIQNDEDKRFLGELFQMIGHHPGGLRLYHHLIKLVKGAS